jgi:hypothetical protein
VISEAIGNTADGLILVVTKLAGCYQVGGGRGLKPFSSEVCGSIYLSLL